MKGLAIALVSSIGAALAAAATQGCILIFVDEPKMPKSMLEK